MAKPPVRAKARHGPDPYAIRNLRQCLKMTG